MYIVVALIILGLLILFHEFGHYIFCRIFGVKVLRFSIGFGPALFSWKKNGTEYRISVLPWGGYVTPLEKERMEEAIELFIKDRMEKKKHLYDEETYRKLVYEMVEEEFGVSMNDLEKNSLDSKPFFQKFMIVFAGPLFNFILGVIIMYFLLIAGVPKLSTKVSKVMEGAPAEKVGIMPGDVILEINGRKVKTWDELKREVVLSEGTLNLKVKRGEEILEFKLNPMKKNGQKVIGVFPSDEKIIIKYSPISALPASFSETFEFILLFFRSIKILFSKEGIESIGGPVMITKLTADAAKQGVIPLLFITFFITVNLAILNLLPIPVLDGGHILIFSIEAISRRKLSYKVRQAVTIAGFFFIISLALLALHNDIKNLFFKKQ